MQCSGSMVMCLPTLDTTTTASTATTTLLGLGPLQHNTRFTKLSTANFTPLSGFSYANCSRGSGLSVQCADTTSTLHRDKENIEVHKGPNGLFTIPSTSSFTRGREIKPPPQPLEEDGPREADVQRRASSSLSVVTKSSIAQMDEVCEKDNTWVGNSLEKVHKEVNIGRLVEKDKKFLADRLDLFRKTSVSFLADVVSLRIFEDTGATPIPPKPWPQPSYPDLSGKALLAADISTITSYIDHIKDLFAVWRVPLQNKYDPEVLASYFNRRPHVLVFRMMQVCAAFSSLYLRLIFDKVSENFSKNAKVDGENKSKGAKMFKEVVLKLGPTFIKAAQSLSTRPDLIGPDAQKVLAELQDRMPPFPNKEAMEVLENDLHLQARDIFEYLSDDPVAAASLGQVYKGRMKDGQEVAVKIQRPNILLSVACDVYILRLGLALVRKLAKINTDLSIFVDEVGRALYGELDYTSEASNASEFAAALSSKLDFVIVPRAIRHLTTRHVLTMEWINGVRPVDLQRIAKGKDPHMNTLQQQQAAKERLLLMVNKGVQSSLTQLLDVGILHGDPHPGNLLYTSNNSIGYLDFGLICHIERKHKYAMIAAVAHLVNGEWGFLTDDLADMDILKPSTDWFGVRLALEDAFSGLVVKNGLPDFRFSQMAGRLFKIALKFRFRLPAYYTLVLRSIASLEGMALAVDPNFKVFARTYPFVLQRLLHDNSPSMRRVLHSLLLTSKGEPRWDRISAIISLAKAASGGAVTTTTSSSSAVMYTMWNAMASKDGVVIRRILLEADTNSLAEAFCSEAALTLRQKVSSLIADSFFQYCNNMLGLHRVHESICTGLNYGSMSRPKIDTKHLLAALRIHRSLQFLFMTMFRRLKAKPLLLLQVIWTGLTIISTAVSLSLHRLCVFLSDLYCEPLHEVKVAKSNILILA